MLPETLNPQYVTDADGRRTGVLLSLDAFEALMEDLDDLATAVERRDEPADLLQAAARSLVFADLHDPAEDLYSAEDGRPFRL